MSYLNNDDPKLYRRVPKIQSQSTSFQKCFRGWTPRPPAYCVPVTNPVEHPYLQISSYPFEFHIASAP